MRQEMNVPLIALMSREKLTDLDSNNSVDDFVVKPCEVNEVAARIKRILTQKGRTESEDIIRCGDLVIDAAKCEVSLCGKPVILTFKEYQLLKFLANSKGKVFTRDILLNKVWGWDYYGGDRTVDVHIRRLRGKIEDSTHAFIETVRNIGYKLRENP
jgi:DNA-binding response OmpR family regulator